jgi:hypothetical protein
VSGLRVSEEHEYDGLDLSLHGEAGYNMEEVSTFGAEVADDSLAGTEAATAPAMERN